MRHAETEFNRKGIIQGSEVDSSINNVGDYQAERFYNFYKNINFDKIYVSGLRRTYQTIIRFVNSGIQCEKLDEFNDQDGDIEFDGERMVNNVDDLMQDVSVLEEFATGKKLTGNKAAKAKKKREDFQRFTEDPVEQANYLEEKYGPAERYYGDPDDFASGGIARMLGE